MSNQAKNKKIIKRIIKLLSLHSSSIHQGERDSCMAMANELMKKYSISMNDVKDNQLIDFHINTKSKIPEQFKRSNDNTPIWVRGIVIQTAILCDLKPLVQVGDYDIVYGSATEENIEYFNLWCDLLISNVRNIVTNTFERQIYMANLGMLNKEQLTQALNSMAYGMSTALLESFSQLPRPSKYKMPEEVKEEILIISGLIEHFPDLELTVIEELIKSEDNQLLDEINSDKCLVPVETPKSTEVVESKPILDSTEDKNTPNLWDTDEIMIQEYVNQGIIVARQIKLTN